MTNRAGLHRARKLPDSDLPPQERLRSHVGGKEPHRISHHEQGAIPVEMKDELREEGICIFGTTFQIKPGTVLLEPLTEKLCVNG